MMWANAAVTESPSCGNEGAPCLRGFGFVPSARSTACVPRLCSGTDNDRTSASDRIRVRTAVSAPSKINRAAGRSAATARKTPSRIVRETGMPSIVSAKTVRLPSNAATGVIASGKAWLNASGAVVSSIRR